MNILEQIIENKRREVAEEKNRVNLSELKGMPAFRREPLSLAKNLLDASKTGIIAEFKRKSPSKGMINGTASVEEVVRDYAKWGASAISVLTDEQFFGGSIEDFTAARAVVPLPLLRKEFIIDEFQIVRSKALGADVILLIAAALKSPAFTRDLAIFAKNTGLQVLLELHAEEELEHICDEVDAVGINNRNLKTFAVDLEQSMRLARQIPEGILKIAESGIHSLDDKNRLQQAGFHGFLIGERFMKEENPGKAFKYFIQNRELTNTGYTK